MMGYTLFCCCILVAVPEAISISIGSKLIISLLKWKINNRINWHLLLLIIFNPSTTSTAKDWRNSSTTYNPWNSMKMISPHKSPTISHPSIFHSGPSNSRFPISKQESPSDLTILRLLCKKSCQGNVGLQEKHTWLL